MNTVPAIELPWTEDAEANRLIASDANALLIGFAHAHPGERVERPAAGVGAPHAVRGEPQDFSAHRHHGAGAGRRACFTSSPPISMTVPPQKRKARRPKSGFGIRAIRATTAP